jgi:hypothetical protein
MFWFVLSMACMLWYSTITIYIAYKGVHDIKSMLARLKASGEAAVLADVPSSAMPNAVIEDKGV